MLVSTGQTEPVIVLMSLVLHGEIVSHIVKLFSSDTLTQVNSLQLRWSYILALGAVLALTTLSLRDVIVVPPLVREGRKRSHIRRGSTLPLLFLLLATFPLLPLEKEKESGTSLKKKKEHSKSRSSKRDKREKKYKSKRSPSPSPSSSSSSVSSDSSSSLQRSPARKKSRINSRSPSPADDNPHFASRTASPMSHRDHLSLFADNDDEFYSHSEDNQDLAPDMLRHSGHRSLGIGHTGNPLDHEHSVHRSQSVRPETLEYGSASLEPDIVLMFLVHHGGITAHIVQLFPFDMLTQVNSFQLHCSGIVVSETVLALTTLSLRDFIVVSPLVQEGRRRSHIIKRKYFHF